MRIRDIEPQVIKVVLTYVYTDQCSQSAMAANADKIMCAAAKYQVSGHLKLLLALFIYSCIHTYVICFLVPDSGITTSSRGGFGYSSLSE